tara:strand:- start:889 stop:1533 length:645 start_codon:yes stop_codon:yes gene_type:complete
MTPKEENTRKKLIKAASELFVELGYDAISVRQIASKAGVNLASINYYFGGKQKLLGEVLKKTYFQLEKRIELLIHESPEDTFTDSVQRLFDLFNLPDFRRSFLNHFKIFLNEEVGFKPLEYQRKEHEPPGFQTLMNKLTSEAGSKISNEDKVWLVKIILTFINHHTLLREVLDPGSHTNGSLLNTTTIKNDLLKLTKIQLNALSNNEMLQENPS